MASRPNDTGPRPLNNLLRRLSAADYALIAHDLDRCDLDEDLLISSEDGRDVEATLVGREGAVGGIVSQGYLPAYSRIVVKFGGPFVRLPIGKLEMAKLQSPSLRDVFARYADCLLAQIFQSTACNAV